MMVRCDICGAEFDTHHGGALCTICENILCPVCEFALLENKDRAIDNTGLVCYVCIYIASHSPLSTLRKPVPLN